MTMNEYGIILPPIPDDLLEALKTLYPARCPDLSDNDREIWFKAGQCQVVAMLEDQRRRQKEADRNTGLDGLYLEENVPL